MAATRNRRVCIDKDIEFPYLDAEEWTQSKGWAAPNWVPPAGAQLRSPLSAPS